MLCQRMIKVVPFVGDCRKGIFCPFWEEEINFHGGDGVWMSCWMGGRERRSRLVNVWLTLRWKSCFT